MAANTEDTHIPHGTADSKDITTENLFKKIGDFGLFQVLLLICSTYAMLCWAALQEAIVIFLVAEPRWECVNNNTVCNITGSVGPGEQNYDYRCGIPRQDWKFVDEFTSLVTQFDLVCEKSSYPQIFLNIASLGGLVGSFFCGILSDKFGRKKILFGSGLMVCSLLLLMSFSQSYLMAAIPLFFTGVGLSGVLWIGLVLMVEYVGIKYRSAMGNGIWFSYAFGFMIIAGIGYLVREWRTLTLIVSLSGVPIFAAYCLFPESLRWLIVNKRTKQALQTLKSIAKINKKVLEDDIQLPTFEEEKEIASGDFRLLFSSGYAVTTLVVWYTWFVNSLVYNALHLIAPNVGGSSYFNWFIAGVAEVASVCFCIYCHNRFGRKKSVIICEIMAALSSLGSVVLTLYDDGSTGFLVGKILMSMVLAKFFITTSFNGIILMTAELYPTVVRNAAQGSSGVFTFIGGIASAYVSYVFRVHPLLPYGIMGVNAFISALLCLTLRETNNLPILEVFPQQQQKDKKLALNDLNQNQFDPDV